MNLEMFQNPSKEFRPIPFWSWNDRLQADELRRQIGEMDSQGWGGFFMHSRIGLETPYMSEEWMRCVGECIQEAGSRGMGAWLYDEDKWPSGYAGGAVPRLSEDYREKALFVSEGSIPYPTDEIKVLKVYEAVSENNKEAFSEFPSHRNHPGSEFKVLREVTGDDALRLTGKPTKGDTASDSKTGDDALRLTGKPTTGDASSDYQTRNDALCLTGKPGLLFFYCWTSPMKYPWFNGTSYVDLLNPKVTEAFITSTHEKYASQFGREFGRTVPGIFTDEPGYLMYGGRFFGRRNVLPWSEVLVDAFREEYNYDILEHLPELFYPLKGYEKTRFDYRKLVNKLFVRNYSKRVYEWCEEHGLKYTGHYLAEDPIALSLERMGSVMQHYVFMHYPGIDHLRRTTADDIVTQKQLQSVVNQFGKERALCETFGCAGQDFSFEGQKWIANWNFVNGVNIINPHLSLYSMRGVRKRDFPPNLFYQQPWWEYNHLCASYQTRLSYALSQGKRIVDILVIHPIESGFILFSPMDKSKTNKLHEEFEKTLWILMENHYDFDLGDEEIMEEHGTVSDGYFQVGESKYKAVVLPPMLTLRESTLRLLKNFIAQRGQVFVMKDYPSHVDGVPDGERVKQDLKAAIPVTYYNLLNSIRSQLEPQVEIRLEDGSYAKNILYHKRLLVNNTMYFFCNNDTSMGYKARIILGEPWFNYHTPLSMPNYKARITLGEQGRINILDPLTGCVTECKSKLQNGRASFEYFFEPCGSLLIQVHTSRTQAEDYEATYTDSTQTVSDENACNDSVHTVSPENACEDRAHMVSPENEWKGFKCKAEPNDREGHSVVIPLSGTWNLDVAEENALVLDYCRYALDENGYSDRIPCIQAYDAIKNGETDHGNFRLQYAFTVEGWDGGGGQLVMEQPEDFHIVMNGKAMKFNDMAYWKDISFRRTTIKDYIVQGENTIELTYCGNDKAEVEAIYIIGDFKVKTEHQRAFRLIPSGIPSFAKNLVEEGYPFYTGKIHISKEINLDAKNIGQCTLRLDEINSTAATVRVNDQKAGDIIWRPYEIDITQYVRTGSNLIEIEMVNSLHNLLGPHHDVCGEVQPFTGPDQFDDRTNWTDTYYLRPFGVTGAVLTRERI